MTVQNIDPVRIYNSAQTRLLVWRELDNENERTIGATAILFLSVQNRQQTHDWTLIESGANALGIHMDTNTGIY